MSKIKTLTLATLLVASMTTTTPAFAELPLNGTSLDGIAEESAANELNGVDVTGVIITPKSSRGDQSVPTPPVFGIPLNGTSLDGLAEDNAVSKLNGIDLADVLLRR